MATVTILPEIFLGPLRVGGRPETRVFSEPLLFTAHYATIAAVVSWPCRAVISGHRQSKKRKAGKRMSVSERYRAGIADSSGKRP